MNYSVRGKKMNCTDFVQILWILTNSVHNPYRCGPLRVGMYILGRRQDFSYRCRLCISLYPGIDIGGHLLTCMYGGFMMVAFRGCYM